MVILLDAIFKISFLGGSCSGCSRQLGSLQIAGEIDISDAARNNSNGQDVLAVGNDHDDKTSKQIGCVFLLEHNDQQKGKADSRHQPTGALCGIPLSVLLHNTWPVLAVAVLLLLLFKSGSSAIGPIFNGISLAVRGLTLFGFCISVLQETTGIVLLEGLTPLAEIYPVICSIGAFLAGILPFFAFVQRLLTAPLTKLAARLQLEPASITGLVVTSANCIPTLLSLDTLEERGITLNTAYAVVAAYSVGDFLAFTLQFSPAHALPMMAGRLLSGLLAVVFCLKTTPKTT